MTSALSNPHPPASPLSSHPAIRRGVKVALDFLIAGAAWAVCVRLFLGERAHLGDLLTWVALAAVVNLTLQLTRQHYRLIGFMDAIRIGLAITSLLVLGLLLGLVTHAGQPLLSHEPVIAASLTTGGAWMALRAIVRALHERAMSLAGHPDIRHQRRTLIIGAGRAGHLMAEELKRHHELGAQLIGFIDDAPDKQGVRLQGVQVFGPSSQIEQIIEDEQIDQVVLAIPSAPGPVIRRLTERLRIAKVEVKTVPGLFNLLGSRNWRPELQDVSIEDLLRREPVVLDQSSLSQVLHDAVVLVTGGGGSIGSEIARQVAAFRPARIVLLGRGENSLWEAERSLRDLFPSQTLSLELCDIRNRTRLQQAFLKWRPEVVFHAAAHKHVPYLELHPEEAVENNCFGTLNVVEAAREVGTHTFVNISTDKAVNPTNVLGATKRIAELIVLRAAQEAPELHRFVSVRFGNVLGSRGSVIPVFRDQLRKGGPLTVTHPEMTRYFMTIPEASQLVLQAGVLGETGKVYVLDMGEPVKIVDLARDMATLSGLTPGQDIDIEFTGIRPGEKLFEELFSQAESLHSNVHPKVLHSAPEDIPQDLLEEGLQILREATGLPEGLRQSLLLQWFKKLVPTYRPSATGLGRFDESTRDRRVSGAHAIYVPKS